MEPKKRRGRKKKYENITNNKITGFIRSTTTGDELQPIVPSSSSSSSSPATECFQFGKGLIIQKYEKKETSTTNVSSSSLSQSKLIDTTTTCQINLDIINDTSNSSKNTPRKSNNILKNFHFLNKAPLLKHRTNNNESKKPVKQSDVTVMLQHGKNVTEWPKETDIWCWWCCHSFKGMPCFIPTKYDSLRKRFKVTGNFCTWNCAKSYMFNDSLGNKRRDIHLFTSLMKHMKLPVDIKPAPRKEILKRFGGILTIEEFRQTFHSRIYNEYEIKHALELDENYRICHNY